jgi:hypothetical protein
LDADILVVRTNKKNHVLTELLATFTQYSATQISTMRQALVHKEEGSNEA